MSSRTEVPAEHAPDQRASQEGSGSDGHGNSSHSGGESRRIFFKTLIGCLSSLVGSSLSRTSPSRSSLSRSSFSRSRKRRPWSKFWIIENRVVSYTPLLSRSSYKQSQTVSK